MVEGVRGQIVKDTTYDLQEANQSLGKFEFIFMLQDSSGGLGCLRDLVSNQLCSVGIGPGAKQMCMYIEVYVCLTI